MAKQRNKETTYRCECCGEPLTDDNCRQVPSEFSESGYSAYCVECENRIYNHFAQSQGKYHALLTACGAFNVPLKPLLLDGVNLDEEPDGWLTYINLLAESGQDRKNGKVLGFADGATTLWSLFGNKLGEPNLEKRIALEKEKIKKQVGSELQRERWGTQPPYKGMTLTQDLYDELDRLYEIRANSYKGQTITPQMDDTLIKVAKSNVIYDHLMRQGLVKAALDVQKNIDLLLASEQMRKKDEKKQENYRIDSQIIALEQAGLFEAGRFLSYEDTCRELVKFARRKGKYDITLDTVDNIVLDYHNAMRKNADQMAVNELDEELKVIDDFGELAETLNPDEIERRRFAGVTEIQIDRVNKKDEP